VKGKSEMETYLLVSRREATPPVEAGRTRADPGSDA